MSVLLTGRVGRKVPCWLWTASKPGKKSEMLLELGWKLWWGCKYGRKQQGSKQGSRGLHTEPLKSYSCLRLDFHCCTYIHLNCCCFWFALRLARGKSALEQLFLPGDSVKPPRNEHKTFLPSPLSRARVFSLLLLPCSERKSLSVSLPSSIKYWHSSPQKRFRLATTPSWPPAPHPRPVPLQFVHVPVDLPSDSPW